MGSILTSSSIQQLQAFNNQIDSTDQLSHKGFFKTKLFSVSKDEEIPSDTTKATAKMDVKSIITEVIGSVEADKIFSSVLKGEKQIKTGTFTHGTEAMTGEDLSNILKKTYEVRVKQLQNASETQKTEWCGRLESLTMEDLLDGKDPELSEMYHSFCESRFVSENMNCLQKIRAYEDKVAQYDELTNKGKNTEVEGAEELLAEINELAEKLVDDYCSESSKFQTNLSSHDRTVIENKAKSEGQFEAMEIKQLRTLFNPAKAAVYKFSGEVKLQFETIITPVPPKSVSGMDQYGESRDLVFGDLQTLIDSLDEGDELRAQTKNGVATLYGKAPASGMKSFQHSMQFQSTTDNRSKKYDDAKVLVQEIMTNALGGDESTMEEIYSHVVGTKTTPLTKSDLEELTRLCGIKCRANEIAAKYDPDKINSESTTVFSLTGEVNAGQLGQAFSEYVKYEAELTSNQNLKDSLQLISELRYAARPTVSLYIGAGAISRVKNLLPMALECSDESVKEAAKELKTAMDKFNSGGINAKELKDALSNFLEFDLSGSLGLDTVLEKFQEEYG